MACPGVDARHEAVVGPEARGQVLVHRVDDPIPGEVLELKADGVAAEAALRAGRSPRRPRPGTPSPSGGTGR
ncbi:MAG: hypothetical protein MZV64_43890 [Ignavibacteriales bacterium]|nr:hypothetical protein [Ignavibacteriales bacterium]